MKIEKDEELTSSFYIFPDLKMENSMNKNINVATTEPISMTGKRNSMVECPVRAEATIRPLIRMLKARRIMLNDSRLLTLSNRCKNNCNSGTLISSRNLPFWIMVVICLRSLGNCDRMSKFSTTCSQECLNRFFG